MATRKLSAELALRPGQEPAAEAVPDPTEWRLPSGQDLISFALATGFAMQPLLEGQLAPADAAPTQPGEAAKPRRED